MPIRYFLPLVIRAANLAHEARGAFVIYQIGVVATAIVFGYGRPY
jgi:hypothetical protein